MSKVSITKANENIKKSIEQNLDSLGGIKNFVKPGETVLLKPNFNTADPFPASSDLEFIKAVIELIYEADAKIVMLAESSTMSANTRKVMQKLGVFELEKMKKPPRIYVLEEREWIKIPIPQGKYLKCVNIPEILQRPDKLILLPCLKTHFQAKYTGALKLSVGLMKPIERISLHMKNIQEKIAELNTVIQPDLVIMDARKCFISGGPMSGDLKEPNMILSSKSRVNIDIEGIKIIQSFQNNSLKNIQAEKLPQIKHAIELGIDQDK
ncbi:DUF362 domain-containing protein [Patescibacteria group bacterium]